MSQATRLIQPSKGQVQEWINGHYALRGNLEPLPGERDLNYRLTTDDAGTFVFKLCPDTDEAPLLEAQHEALALLQQHDLAAIPRVIPSRTGDSLITLRADSQDYLARLLSYVPGKVLAGQAPYSTALLEDLGRTMGQFDRALVGYDHPAFHYPFDWDLGHARDVVARYRGLIADPQLRSSVDRIDRNFCELVVPRFEDLRKSVIHNDANDHNVLAEGDRISGVIDFGDMIHTFTICDPAIAIAYATLESEDVLDGILTVTRGYHASLPLLEAEVAVLFPMVCMRLAVSACMAAHQMRLRPDDPYLSISQEPIRRTLPKLMALEADLVHQQLKEALT